MLRCLPNSTALRFRSPIQPPSLVLPPLSCMPTLWYFYPALWYYNPSPWYILPSLWYFLPSLWYFHPSMVLSPRSLSGTFTPSLSGTPTPLSGTSTPLSGTPTLSVSYSYYIVSSLLLLYILNAHICPYLIPYTRTAALYSRML